MHHPEPTAMSPTRLISSLCAAVLAAPVFAAQVAEPKPDDRELHVVCFARERGAKAKADDSRAAVRVARPGKQLTLVLASDEPVTWTVAVTDGTRPAKGVLM